VVLHAKYIRPADEKKLALYLQNHTLSILLVGIGLLFSVLFFGDSIAVYVRSHTSVFYSILFILFFGLIAKSVWLEW
jgi:uncharacterized membrane protein